MKSFNQILENTPIIFESNYISESIKFKNFDLLVSHHDIHEFNNNSINGITEKYLRRHKRLLNTIKEQHNINFFRYCKNQQDIEEEIIKFYINIFNINPNSEFKFILISDHNNLMNPKELSKDNSIYINLNKYIYDDIF